jgi:hypothetical protein
MRKRSRSAKGAHPRSLRIQARIAELRERSLKRTEITSAGLIQHAMDVFTEAKAAKQYSAAVAALREAAVLAGVRVERKESGDAGAYAKLSSAELDELILVEYARLKALPAPDSDKAEASSAKPD